MPKRNNGSNTSQKLAPSAEGAAELSKGVAAVLAKAEAQDAQKATGKTNDQPPAVQGLGEAGQRKVAELLKEGKITAALDKKDAKFCHDTMGDLRNELERKGGYHDLVDALAESRATLTKLAFNLCLRAEVAHKGQGYREVAVRVAYLDRLNKEIEVQAQTSDRNERMGKAARGDNKVVDMPEAKPVKELLGQHWVTMKSKLRKAMIAGFLPSQFLNGTSFINAAKEARKTGGSQNAGNSTGRAAAAQKESVATLAKAAGFGSISATALNNLITAVKGCDPEESDAQVAQILTEATQRLIALASGSEQNADFDKGLAALDAQAATA